MDIKDIKVGMKVKLLGKHRFGDDYDNIEDWFEDYYNEEDVQQIKEQGYGVVTYIDEHGNNIWVSECENGREWIFLPCDLEPYEEPTQTKSPKEWLLTVKAIYTLRNNVECITLGDGKAYRIDKPMLWNQSLNTDYDEDLNFGTPYNIIKELDIMKIEYQGETVWERKEYVTLTDAIKTGKKIKYKDWNDFISPTQALILISNDVHLINLFTEKVWEVE